MPVFHILSALLLAACVFWLKREEHGRSRFACALYFLLAFEGMRLAAAVGGLEGGRVLGAFTFMVPSQQPNSSRATTFLNRDASSGM